ncbi:MAG: hypothetical protein WB996_12845 [Ignavibacteriaceae bacterium]
MEKFDLGLAYVWEYDVDFINLAERTLQNSGISTYQISNHNIFDVTQKIKNKELAFNFYLDRAADVDEDFEELGKIISRRKTKIFNPYKKTEHAIDKANMHLEFISGGLHVPYSIIIPPHSETEEIYISLDNLSVLGRPFIIKPCNTTGGGIGVVTGAETLREIIDERITNLDDKYILQQKIYPDYLEGKRGWFRCFWAFGKAIPAWWDDQTHIYRELNENEIEKFNLKKLFTVTKKIAKITELDFFSTEIVLTPDKNFVVVDYVNDQCDMRFKSFHVDGVPDSIVKEIIDSMKRIIIREKKKLN